MVTKLVSTSSTLSGTPHNKSYNKPLYLTIYSLQAFKLEILKMSIRYKLLTLISPMPLEGKFLHFLETAKLIILNIESTTCTQYIELTDHVKELVLFKLKGEGLVEPDGPLQRVHLAVVIVVQVVNQLLVHLIRVLRGQMSKVN